ncbi:carboxylesterase/lipase family protein [Microbacterium memoriense]|uniref:Carboxylic ester hydrolase n=1 Tax=Microbacterium memoriense TaxID=2978350 RepID=A0ABT2PCX7_9MICO|nr:carboxylesterase family protein [Microbacterium memoriense]MCT9002442.1 carboxylesterase family protein [Microbacterium memoriense]
MTTPARTDPVVRITPGKVRGRWRTTTDAHGRQSASAVFFGIPFAQAPIGALRFASPVPPEPWPDVRDALVHGPTACRTDPGDTLIPEPVFAGESTLNVDVCTPAPGDPEAGLPVLVYIHGGGYVSGTPASPWYDGRAFARDGVVTVSVSYRLGFDGFGHIDGAVANRGVRDWLAALEWVQENISAFGGDPARVTLAGQSAGGGGALTLLGMPAAQHLFHAVWSMSGALADVPAARARAISERLAHLAGVKPTRTGFASVDEADLVALQQRAAEAPSRDRLAPVRAVLSQGLAYGPVIDGELLTRSTPDSIAAGVGADKPLVLGTNDDEFTMVTDSLRAKLRLIPASLALRALGVPHARRRAYLCANLAQRRLGTAAVLGRFAGDTLFRAPLVRVAEARGAGTRPLGAPTWVYRFVWPSPTRRWALHCLDVPFWFDCLDAERVAAIAGDDPPQGLADTIHGAALGLIRAHAPGWEPWSERSGTTRIFGGTASADAVIADGYASVRPLV